MSLVELTDARATVDFLQYELQSKIVGNCQWMCCANCNYLNETICKQNNLPIPPKVAVLGCRNWDYLPF